MSCKYWKRCIPIMVMVTISPLFAYRPLGTEDAGVAGKGVFQLEVSYDYLKWESGHFEYLFLIVPIYGQKSPILFKCLWELLINFLKT